MSGLPARVVRCVMLAAVAVAVAGCQREGIFLKQPLVQPLRKVDVMAAVQPATLTRQDFMHDIETDRPKATKRPLRIPWINEERFGELIQDQFAGTKLFQSASPELPDEQLEKWLVLQPHVNLKQYVRPSLTGTMLTLGTGLLYNILGGSNMYRFVDCELTMEAETPAGRHVASYFSSRRSEERLVTDARDQLGPLVSIAFTRALGDVANQIAMDNDLLVRALSPEMTEKGLGGPDGARINVHSPRSLVVRTNRIHIAGEVTGIDRPVELRWSLNAKDAGKIHLVDTRSASRKEFAFDALLEDGDAKVRLTLLDRSPARGAVADLAVKEIPYLCVTQGPKVRERWAVVIGISKYAYSGKRFGDLKYAAEDARLFRDFLASPESGGFSKDHIRCLLDQEASLAKVRSALFEFLARAHEDDLVEIFISAHGMPEDRSHQLFLLCHDTDPERMSVTGFPMWDIATALDRFCPAKRVVVYADACHAGGLAGDQRAKGSQHNPVNEFLEQLAETQGRLIFTASRAGERTVEADKYGHGVFTRHLVDGLKGKADRDSNSLITAKEIIEYVCPRVVADTGNKVHPSAAGDFDPRFPLARVVK